MVEPIYVNSRFLSQRITGVQRYAVEITSRLNISNQEIIYLAPQRSRERRTEDILPPKSVGILRGHAWEQLELPIHAAGGLLINFCNAAPILAERMIVTIHDAAPFAVPDAYSIRYRLWFKSLTRILCRRSLAVVTVSEFAKAQIIKYVDIDPEKIHIISPSHSHSHIHRQKIFSRPNVSGSSSKNRPYILTVGSQGPHKNINRLISAYRLLKDLDVDLYIVGGRSSSVHRPVEPLEDLKGLKYLGYVTDSELRILYENALMYVHPAYYEGFGIPPLEAMALGCPVISSSLASLPEVCGDAALYCDVYNPYDIARQIEALARDADAQERHRSLGLSQSRRFSWEASASKWSKLVLSLQQV